MFESPHDHPPKWVLVLTAYLDESSGQGDGFYVIGGYLGDKEAWTHLVREWRDGLGDRQGLHLKNLRLGSNGDRHKLLLETLGAKPRMCGLIPVRGSVRTSDYLHLTHGTAARVGMEGYALALWPTVSKVLDTVPPDERVELIFAEQVHYAGMREAVLSTIASLGEYRNSSGLSKLAKWSSMPMSMILEPSDYLAYALLQRDIDPCSEKARLTSPILQGQEIHSWHLGREESLYLLAQLKDELGERFNLGEDGVKILRREFNAVQPSDAGEG